MARYLSAGTAPYPGYHQHTINARAKYERPIMALWVQEFGYDSKSEADTLIQLVKDWGLTDMFLMVDTNTYTQLMAYAPLCSSHITATLYDGQYPMVYMARQLKLLGCRVHAWWVIMYFVRWGTSGFTNSPLDSATYRDPNGCGGYGILRMDIQAAREFVASIIGDFHAYNRHVAGVHLDYIRTDGCVDGQTAANITDLVARVRAACNDKILGTDVLNNRFGEYSGDNVHNQQPRTWAATFDLDMLTAMGYSKGLDARSEQLLELDGRRGTEIVLGVEGDPAFMTDHDLVRRFIWQQYRGIKNFALFDEGVTRWQSAALENIPPAIHIHSNVETLDYSVEPVTNIQVSQGVSITLGHQGHSHTVTWAQLGIGVSDDPADIKTAAETTIGHSLGGIVFYYISSTLYVMFGDWAVW